VNEKYQASSPVDTFLKNFADYPSFFPITTTLGRALMDKISSMRGAGLEKPPPPLPWGKIFPEFLFRDNGLSDSWCRYAFSMQRE